MALRGADEVGVRDVRRFADLQIADAVAPPSAPERAPNPPPAPRKPMRKKLASVPSDSVDADAVERRLIGDEVQVYLQASVPQAALQRVKLVSFEVGEDRPHLRRHQTIVGALVWQFVDHTDQSKLDELAELVDAYREGPWHGLAEVRRLSARIPTSLKRRVEGSLLALAGSQRDVSARLLVAALVWRHVVSREEDAARFARLVDLLGAYHQELSRRSLAAPVATTPRSG